MDAFTGLGGASRALGSAASLGSSRSALFVRLRVFSRRLRGSASRREDGAAHLRLCPLVSLQTVCSRRRGLWLARLTDSPGAVSAARSPHKAFSPRGTTSNDPTAERRKLFRQLGERNSARAVPEKVNIRRPALPRLASTTF